MFIAASSSEAQSNRQMNQMSGGHKPGFTATQGQHLAFIGAYTLRRHTAVRPSDDSGPRTCGPHSPPTRGATQHRGARSSRTSTHLGNARPTIVQQFSAFSQDKVEDGYRHPGWVAFYLVAAKMIDTAKSVIKLIGIDASITIPLAWIRVAPSQIERRGRSTLTSRPALRRKK